MDHGITREHKGHCIAMLDTAVLTTIHLLIQKQLFFDDKRPLVRNLILVLALWLQSTLHFAKDNLCLVDENGWAAEVVRLARQHQVRISLGVDDIQTNVTNV